MVTSAHHLSVSRARQIQSKSPSTPGPPRSSYIQNLLPSLCNQNVYCYVMQGTILWQLLTYWPHGKWDRSTAGSWTCPVQYGRLSAEHVAKSDTALPTPPMKPYSFLTSNDYVITVLQLTFLHTQIRRLKWRQCECQKQRHFGSQYCDTVWRDLGRRSNSSSTYLCSVYRFTQPN